MYINIHVKKKFKNHEYLVEITRYLKSKMQLATAQGHKQSTGAVILSGL